VFAQGVSVLGTQVTRLAVPLLVAIQLHGTAGDMSFVVGATYIGYIIGGVCSGALVDRFGLRSMLVSADALRCVLVASVTAGAFSHILSPLLVACAVFFVGLLTAIYDAGAPALVSCLVDGKSLLQVNARMHATNGVAQLAGAALAAGLVGAIGIANAMIIDAGSYLISAVTLFGVRAKHLGGMGERPARGAGFAFLARSRFLLSMTLLSSAMSVFVGATSVAHILFVTRKLHLSGGMVGVISVGSGAGALSGALIGRTLRRRWSLASIIVAASAALFLSSTLLVFGHASPTMTTAQHLVAMFAMGSAMSVVGVNTLTERQLATPIVLQPRVHAAHRMVTWGSAPIGAAFAGLLGARFAPRDVLMIISGGWATLAGCVVLLRTTFSRSP
jgi:hypothetical protein